MWRSSRAITRSVACRSACGRGLTWAGGQNRETEKPGHPSWKCFHIIALSSMESSGSAHSLVSLAIMLVRRIALKGRHSSAGAAKGEPDSKGHGMGLAGPELRLFTTRQSQIGRPRPSLSRPAGFGLLQSAVNAKEPGMAKAPDRPDGNNTWNESMANNRAPDLWRHASGHKLRRIRQGFHRSGTGLLLAIQTQLARLMWPTHGILGDLGRSPARKVHSFCRSCCGDGHLRERRRG